MIQRLIVAADLDPGALVVDLGCADKPYRSLLPRGTRYIGADLPGNPNADVYLTDEGIVPLPDGTADLVLSTQVLEHVADPERYLSECFRLLRPGGSLVLSTHGIMYYHQDPEDYWRWTAAGLRHLLAKHEFEVPDQAGALGLTATALQLIQHAQYLRVPARLRNCFFFMMQVLIRLADRNPRSSEAVSNCMVVGVRAVRP